MAGLETSASTQMLRHLVHKLLECLASVSEAEAGPSSLFPRAKDSVATLQFRQSLGAAHALNSLFPAPRPPSLPEGGVALPWQPQ